MASISARLTRSGKKLYRVRFRNRDQLIFHITFDDKKAAQKWAEENEDEILTNPKKFQKWKQSLFSEMQLKGTESVDHIRKPKPLRKFI